MFVVAVGYTHVSPAVTADPKTGMNVWFAFFHAVAQGRKVTVSKFCQYGCQDYRVEFDGKEFEFIRFAA